MNQPNIDFILNMIYLRDKEQYLSCDKTMELKI